MNQQTIEIAPSWKQNMAILILALESGTAEGKRLARAELLELAGKLDERNRRERVAELLEHKKNLIKERIQTAGHGRRARIQEQIDAADVELNQLLDQLADVDQAPADPLAPGAILYSSWGYEQTNVDFYRIEKRAGAWLTLQQIEAAEASDGADSMTGKVVPADPPRPKGEPIRRKILGDPVSSSSGCVVKIESYAFAYLWDGQPKRVSHYA